MKHRRKLVKLNRNSKQRQALFRIQLRHLVVFGSLTTTEAKAKKIKRLMDKIVYKAKDNSVASRRNLHRVFGDRRIVNILVDQIAPLYQDRNSGFTTMSKLARRRGDNALMVKLAFIKQREGVGELKKQTQTGKAPSAKSKTKKVASKPKESGMKPKIMGSKPASQKAQPTAKIRKTTKNK